MEPNQAQLQVGGTLDSAKHIYIVRREDEELLDLLEAGEYCNVLSSRQVGKSSLIIRSISALKRTGHRVAYVDVAGDLASPADANEWFVALLLQITQDVEVEWPANWWRSQPEATANQKLQAFFRDVILQKTEPIVIFLDEIEHTLKFDYTDDLFTAIRAMYNRRAREPIFSRLTFCLSGVATPNELIKNRRTTAYNIGKTIELTDFDLERHDLTPFARAVSKDLVRGEAIVRAILDWTAGHPFLTARLVEQFITNGGAEERQVDTMVRGKYRDLDHLETTDAVHFQQVTRFLDERATNGAAAIAIYERILRGRPERDKPTEYHSQLKLTGLVNRGPSGTLAVRNRIYATLFDLDWVRRSLPGRRARRQRLALFGVAAALVLTVAAVTLYVGFVSRPRAQAGEALAALRTATEESRADAAYAAIMSIKVPVVFNLGLLDLRMQAAQARQDFWIRRAAALDRRALQQLKAGELEAGLILGAAAAVKRDGPINGEIQAAFDNADFEHLIMTVPGLGGSASPNMWGEFSADGRSVLVTPADWGPGQLFSFDMSSARQTWSRAFKSSAFFLADGRTIVEIEPDGARVWRADQSDEQAPLAEIPIPLDLTSALTYQGNTNFAQRRAVQETDATWLTNLWHGVGACAREALRVKATRGRESLISFAVSDSGRYAFFNDTSGYSVCDTYDGRLVLVRGQPSVAHGYVPSVFSLDESAIATILRDEHYEQHKVVLRVRDGGILFTQRLEGDYPWGPMSFERAGQWLLLGKDVVNAKTWKAAPQFKGRVEDLTADGHVIVTAGKDRSVVVDLETRREVVTLRGGTHAMFSPDGSHVVLGGRNVRVWDLQSRAGSRRVVERQEAKQRWDQWQTKLGLTVTDDDDVVSIAGRGPRVLRGPNYR
jgi:hypothetical protein